MSDKEAEKAFVMEGVVKGEMSTAEGGYTTTLIRLKNRRRISW